MILSARKQRPKGTGNFFELFIQKSYLSPLFLGLALTVGAHLLECLPFYYKKAADVVISFQSILLF